MKVTEQVDALETLAYDRNSYLVVPRVLAATLMFPVVTAFAMAVGVAAGWITAINLLDLSTPEFLKGLKQFYRFKDIWFGLVKSASFGAAVALMGCLRGLDATGGRRRRRALDHPRRGARLRGDPGARRVLGAGASVSLGTRRDDRPRQPHQVLRREAGPARGLARGARRAQHGHHRPLGHRQERHPQAHRRADRARRRRGRGGRRGGPPDGPAQPGRAARTGGLRLPVRRALRLDDRRREHPAGPGEAEAGRGRPSGSGSRRASPSSSCRAWRTSIRRSSAAACASGSASRARSPSSRATFSTTSRPPGSTRSPRPSWTSS